MSKFDMLALVFSGLAASEQNKALNRRIEQRKRTEELAIQEAARQQDVQDRIAEETKSDRVIKHEKQIEALRAASAEGGATVRSLRDQVTQVGGDLGLSLARIENNRQQLQGENLSKQKAAIEDVRQANLVDQSTAFQSSLNFFGDVAGASLRHAYKPTKSPSTTSSRTSSKVPSRFFYPTG